MAPSTIKSPITEQPTSSPANADATDNTDDAIAEHTHPTPKDHPQITMADIENFFDELDATTGAAAEDAAAAPTAMDPSSPDDGFWTWHRTRNRANNKKRTNPTPLPTQATDPRGALLRHVVSKRPNDDDNPFTALPDINNHPRGPLRIMSGSNNKGPLQVALRTTQPNDHRVQHLCTPRPLYTNRHQDGFHQHARYNGVPHMRGTLQDLYTMGATTNTAKHTTKRHTVIRGLTNHERRGLGYGPRGAYSGNGTARLTTYGYGQQRVSLADGRITFPHADCPHPVRLTSGAHNSDHA